MTTQEAKALIGLCVHEGLKQGVLKGKGEFEELLDYLDKYFIDIDKRASGSSEIPKDLEEAAKEYFYNSENSWEIMNVFIAGAEWQKEQMMKEAVEGEIKDFRFVREINYSSAKIEFNSIPKLKEGDRVCMIVLPKEN